MLRILALLACALPASTAGLSGQWAATLTANNRTIPFHVEWTQTPSTLTGAIGQRSDFLWPIANPKLDGSKLTFTWRFSGAGPEASFEGTLDGDTIMGQLTSRNIAGPLQMKRTGPLTSLPSNLAVKFAALDGLSDDFDSPASLKSWKTLDQAEQLPNRIDRTQVSDGKLTIVPKSAAWWAGYHGVFLFKEVTGDFVLTTRLKVTGNTGAEPENIWTISGLLLRTPANTAVPLEQRKENWVYLMTGRGPEQARVVDAKSTRDSSNAWDITPAQPGWYELRIARIGSLFLLFERPDGASWSFRKIIVRDDLPATLQAGVNVTSDVKLSGSMPPAKYNSDSFEGQSKIDALTQVDWVRFTAVPKRKDDLARLAGKALLDVTAEDFLRAFN